MTLNRPMTGSDVGGLLPPAWAPAPPRPRHGLRVLVTAALVAGVGYAAADPAPGTVFALAGGLLGGIGVLAAVGIWVQNNVP